MRALYTIYDLVYRLNPRLPEGIDICARNVAEVDRSAQPQRHRLRFRIPLVRLEQRTNETNEGTAQPGT